jgi:hypothetical protein
MIPRRAEPEFSSIPVILIVLLALLSVLGTVSITRAEDRTPSQEILPNNEVFLRGALRSLIEETFSDFPKNTPDFVILKAEEDRAENWLLEDELLTYLMSLKFQVGLSAADSNRNLPESKLLFYRIIDLKLDYPQTQRKGIWGRKSVTRRAGMVLSFREEDRTTGKILWSRRGQGEKTDMVQKSLIPSLNNQSYPFLCPSVSRDSWSRYVEPALVTTIVGGLVYLFFANR